MHRPVVAALLLFLALAVPGAPAGEPTMEEVTVVAADGVELKVTIHRPDGSGPFPAMILPHGFGNTRQDEADHAHHYAERGWLALTYDARGFGQSGGTISLNGPKEVADVIALVDYLAQRGDVRLDGPGDPRVGLRGGSYGGAIQLLAAAADPRLDALVPLITWNDLAASLFPHDVFKSGWATLFYLVAQGSGHGLTSGNPNLEGADPALTQYFLTALGLGEPTPEIRGYLEPRSPAAVLDHVRAPVFLIQGWRDTLFTAEEATRTFTTLRENGVAAKLLFYGGGHGYDDALPREEETALEARIDAWLGFWLEGLGTPEDVYAAPVEWWSEPEQRFVAEQAWPLLDGGNLTYYFQAGAQGSDGELRREPPSASGRTVAVAGGATSYSEVPAFQSQLPTDAVDAPVTSVAFATPPLEDALPVVGVPHLRLLASATSARVALFVKVYDQAPDGSEVLVDRQVTPLRTGPADATLDLPQLLEVNLVPFAHTFAPGHRLRVVVATSDAAYASNRVPAAVGLHHDAAGDARLELAVHPAARHDVAPPHLGPLQLEERGGRPWARVDAWDDAALAQVLLVARAGDRHAAWLPTAREGDTFLFALEPLGSDALLRVLATDAAGNRAGTNPILWTGARAADVDGEGIPAPGLAWIVLVALTVAWVRRRRGGSTDTFIGPLT